MTSQVTTLAVLDCRSRSVADAVREFLDAEVADAEVAVIVSGTAGLHPDALRRLGQVFADPEVEVAYGAESHDGASVLRPGHSPERLRCQYFWGDVVAYRRSTLGRLGVDELPGAELYDLALRASAAGVGIRSVTDVLAITSGERPALGAEALGSTRAALERHLAATGGGEVRSLGADGVHDTRRAVVGEPLISIVIPTRGIYQLVGGRERCFPVEAVRSIVERSTYRNVEFVMVVDEGADARAVAELEAAASGRLTFVEWAGPFNFSEKVNAGALRARGEFVLLLNDDVEVITEDWLESMLALAQRPNAGMVGAMLYYDDDTIQHAGHHYWRGDASHIGLDEPRAAAGPLAGYRVEREVAGITAACALMPREVYFAAGGLSALLPGAFNDVDLCMKTTWRGYDIYWTPHAQLYHFESKSRDATVHGFEVDVAWGRWGFRMHEPKFWPYELTREPHGR